MKLRQKERIAQLREETGMKTLYNYVFIKTTLRFKMFKYAIINSIEIEFSLLIDFEIFHY